MGPTYFSLEIFENYLVFIPGEKYIRYFNDTNQFYSWNLMKCQKKVLKIYLNILLDVSFNGHCLIQNNLSIPKKMINIYVSYILNQCQEIWMQILD